MAFKLQTRAFAPGAAIPAEHTCDGADRSPPLEWSDPSAETKSFVLIAALDLVPELSPRPTRAELERRIAGHVLARAELMGRYQRRT